MAEAKYDKRNRGVLFTNDRKLEEQHTDYQGEIDVEGKPYWLNAWVNTSKKGTKYLSVRIKPKTPNRAQLAQIDGQIPFYVRSGYCLIPTLDENKKRRSLCARFAHRPARQPARARSPGRMTGVVLGASRADKAPASATDGGPPVNSVSVYPNRLKRTSNKPSAQSKGGWGVAWTPSETWSPHRCADAQPRCSRTLTTTDNGLITPVLPQPPDQEVPSHDKRRSFNADVDAEGQGCAGKQSRRSPQTRAEQGIYCG